MATTTKTRTPRKATARARTVSTKTKPTNGKVTGRVAKTATRTVKKAAPTKAKVNSTKTKAKEPTKTSATSPWFDKIGGPKLREESIKSGKHRAEWTAKDDKIVVSQKLSITEIAQRLGRSYHAVASRRAILKAANNASK